MQMGILRSQVNLKDLERLDEEVISGPAFKKTGSGKIKMSKSATVSTEINLLGKTVDEALSELGQISGRRLPGPPVQRARCPRKRNRRPAQGGSQLFKAQKHVASYRLGEFGEGDAGVTIVTFKG